MAHDVFICHSASDRMAGLAVRAALEANGIRCWIAPHDADDDASDFAAIAASKLVVIVSTPRADTSERVSKEIDCAVKAGIPIVPVPADAVQDLAKRGRQFDDLLKAVSVLLDKKAGPDRAAAGLRLVPAGPEPSEIVRVLRGYFSRPALVIAALGATFVVFVVWQLAMDSFDQDRQTAANNPSGVIDHPSPDGAPGRIAHPRSGGKPHVCLSDYPADSVRLGEQGTTTLGFTILSDGTTSDIQVVRSSGFPRLDGAAIRCASSWLYRPATKDGNPVAVPWKAEVKWVLH